MVCHLCRDGYCLARANLHHTGKFQLHQRLSTLEYDSYPGH
jgi:hypothetical protein